MYPQEYQKKNLLGTQMVDPRRTTLVESEVDC